MNAYLIGHIRVIDPEAWRTYVAGVAESLRPFKAEIVFRGRRHSVLTGEHDQDLIVVIRFADQPTLQEWHQSDRYQALIELRDRAADVTIVSYDTQPE